MTRYRQKDEQGRVHFNMDFGTWFITAGTDDDFDKIDAYLTAKTDLNRTYGVEIKDYTNSGFDRPYSKYIWNGIDGGYQIDYDKVDYLVMKCQEEGRIPILYARFTDLTIVWDLRTIPYNARKKQVWVNKDGQSYGKEKELVIQTYLYKDEAKYIKKTITK